VLTNYCPTCRSFHKAVHDALVYREFLHEKEPASGASCSSRGSNGLASWRPARRRGLRKPGSSCAATCRKSTARCSRTGWSCRNRSPRAADAGLGSTSGFHGRGENLTEVNFLSGRQKDRGVFTPADTVVLHPYGRFCNAFKFAGEVDVLEATESVSSAVSNRRRPDRRAGLLDGGRGLLAVRRTLCRSLGGATPGAGFSETPQFLKEYQKETLTPPGGRRSSGTGTTATTGR